MGDDWAAYLIRNLEPQPERIIVVGGSSRFIAWLVTRDYSIVKIDKQQTELESASQFLAECFATPPQCVEYVNADISCVSANGFRFRDNDVVVFLRSVHHLDNPTLGVSGLLKEMPRGTIILLDLTEELLARARSEDEKIREMVKIGLAEDPEKAAELEKMENYWRVTDRVHEECLRCLRSFGFLNEGNVKGFLNDLPANSPEFKYTLPCPCLSTACHETAWYWCAVLRKELPRVDLANLIAAHEQQRGRDRLF